MALLGLDSPTKKGIFGSYIGLWCALRMLIYGSGKKLDYDQTTLLVFVCVLKLILATGMYLQTDGSLSKMLLEWRENKGVFFRYFFPAASYVVYDNLTFVNLRLSDPVTYAILMQIRLAVTGLSWQMFFGKNLNKNQWIAIGLLTVACLCQKGRPLIDGSAATTTTSTSAFALFLIAFQIMCGVFSSLFNEFLLKEKGGTGVNLQNIFMYTHGIVCNVVWLMVCPEGMCKKDLWAATESAQLQKMMHPLVLPIIFILATIGIVTSLFIKHLDSVRKTIASAIEIFVDAILAFLLFGIPINFETVLAICFASSGVILYARPVSVKRDEPLPPVAGQQDPEAVLGGDDGQDVQRNNSFGSETKRKVVVA